MDKLLELISAGPNPRYSMKAAVLERYHDILRARQLMRTWSDIAVALDYDKARWKDVAATFNRVATGVKTGKLVVTKQVTTAAKAAQSDTTPQPPATRPLPGQIPVGDGDAMNAALAAKGLKWRN